MATGHCYIGKLALQKVVAHNQALKRGSFISLCMVIAKKVEPKRMPGLLGKLISRKHDSPQVASEISLSKVKSECKTDHKSSARLPQLSP